MSNILISIDPGLKTSGTGIAVFVDSDLRGVRYAPPLKGEFTLRARMNPVVSVINSVVDTLKPGDTLELVVEESFYQGTANKMHLRFMGVLDYFFPTMDHISPMTVKAKLGVSKLRADKTLPKKEQKEFLKHCVKKAVLDRLTVKDISPNIACFEQDDVVDAVAIGLAYLGR
jgi:Holliday junction resolvasome RuvABC endonuclease subunit